jgi:hypothetical protein
MQYARTDGLDSNALSSATESLERYMHASKSLEDCALANAVNHPESCLSAFPSPDPAPANSPNAVSAARRLPEHEVDFAELEDGTLVEMIEDPDNCANSLFAIYKDGAVRNAAAVERDNCVLVPVPRGQGIFKYVRLPRGSQSHQPPRVLLGAIMAVILNCVDISNSDACLVAAFVLSTWFTESLQVAPYLELVGVPRSGKTTLLQVLNLLCRRPFLTADVTSAAFYDVYERLTPTLLVDEILTTTNRRALFHLLKTGSTRGSVTLRKGRSLKAFGPKVISCIEMPKDAGVNTRCVIISMQETARTDLIKPSDKKISDHADVLQKQLLRYRLENYTSLRVPKITGDERLHSRTRDLYQALALPLGSNADICEYLVQLFETQQEIHREPLSPPTAAVLRLIFEYIHSHPKDGECAQKELTAAVNLNLEGLQETFRLNPHEVGRALTSLGLTNRKRTNAGFIVYLDLWTRKRIHKLARDHWIDQDAAFSGGTFGKDCELCTNTPATERTAEIKRDSEIMPK